ncbi:hypothetical protein HWC80_gp005 [Mycobacterium phage Indlulamithi]|uniref:Uncharacterized protein n=1 Tax=Mycobacterium phage Indlulamithi TaxID=2656582 RepID=A0A649VCK7_9CAUD|nr:hypothetical protein HWC80_gp005 [Mycobacterium phage Indlulamithi]QGJ90046.1 hypothetical protein PBI_INDLULAMITHI_5 [Mycobacterium phage Indlulamithi]
MARKSSGGSAAMPMIGSKAPGKVKQPAKIPAGFKGAKAGKARASKGGSKKLKTLGGQSGIMNPPTGGGY